MVGMNSSRKSAGNGGIMAIVQKRFQISAAGRFVKLFVA
jgi:hypothetical protein